MEIEQIKQTMLDAIATGEIITIIYHGGSEPGSVRMISPIKVKEKIVWARCLTSKKVKSFSLNKIELSAAAELTFTGLHPRPESDNEPPDPVSLKLGIDPFIDELTSLGWLIQLGDDEIDLFSRFKNGKPKKYPSLYFSFDLGPDHYITKPWKTCGHAFKYFRRALAKFMDEARAHSPIPQ